MFKNSGKKIKTFATIYFWILIVGSLAGAVVGFDSTALLGVLCLVVGPIFAYVSSLFMYGFGEIIDLLKIQNHSTNTDKCPDKNDSANTQQIANQNKNNDIDELLASGLITQQEYQQISQKRNK